MHLNAQYILPFYHAISDEELIHLKHLFPVKSTKSFIKDLDFFCSKYTPISLDDFFHLAKDGFKSLKKPVFHLSFDDGLRQCYDVILPILEAKGIPATFFVNSAFVDNKDLFFRFKESLLIEALHKKRKNLKLEKRKNLRTEFNQKAVLDNLAEQLDINFKTFLTQERPYLTIKQLKVMEKKNFSIGGHSVNHPEFRLLNTNERIWQITQSMQFVNQQFSIPVKAFSFPFTDYQLNNTFFENIKIQNIIDISFGTAGIKDDKAIMNFQRIPMENGYSGKQTYYFQILKRMLRKLLGVNSIDR